MGSKHKNLEGMEKLRLLRDFEKYGYKAHVISGYDEGSWFYRHDGWIILSPSEADRILEELWRIRDLER